jgi:hypothetical protein
MAVDLKSRIDPILSRLQVEPHLAFEFIAAFSRVEYAFKAMGWIRERNRRFPIVEADWDQMVDVIKADFEANSNDVLMEATSYLVLNPPRVQCVTFGKLDWRPLVFKDGDVPLMRLVKCVKTVRNNLLHGGKYGPDDQFQFDRSTRLVASSLAVIDGIIDASPEVASWFHHG